MRTVEDVRAWLAKLDRDGLQLDAERSPLAEVLRKKLAEASKSAGNAGSGAMAPGGEE